MELDETLNVLIWNINKSRYNKKKHSQITFAVLNILFRALLFVKKYMLTEETKYLEKCCYNLKTIDFILKDLKYSRNILGYSNVEEFYNDYICEYILG